jgi:hypothetical protein
MSEQQKLFGAEENLRPFDRAGVLWMLVEPQAESLDVAIERLKRAYALTSAEPCEASA